MLITEIAIGIFIWTALGLLVYFYAPEDMLNEERLFPHIHSISNYIFYFPAIVCLKIVRIVIKLFKKGGQDEYKD